MCSLPGKRKTYYSKVIFREVLISLLIPTHSLCEKCPKTEFFLVRIQENTDLNKTLIQTLSNVVIRLKSWETDSKRGHRIGYFIISRRGLAIIKILKLIKFKILWRTGRAGACVPLLHIIFVKEKLTTSSLSA